MHHFYIGWNYHMVSISIPICRLLLFLRCKSFLRMFPQLENMRMSFRFLKNGEGHKKVMWRHTKVKVSKIEGAPMVPLCLKFGCRVKKWEKSRVEVFIYDFPKLHHSSPNSFGANGHLHKKVCKTGKVIERSRDVTPRPKREKSKGPPRSPCALNMVQFRPLFPELRHFEKNGTRHFF